MIRLAGILSLFGLPAAAQHVSQCDWQARADSIVEPWEENARTFANGAVRVALLDTLEPAFGAYYLLVLSPPYDELGVRQCQVIGFDEGIGFTHLDFDSLSADYVPGQGLEMHLLGRIAAPEHDFTNSMKLWAILNQSSGEIATFMELGRE